MSMWLLLIVIFVRLNESRYRLVMRLRVHRRIPGTRVYRSKWCHACPSGWWSVLPLSPGINVTSALGWREWSKKLFVHPWFSEWTRTKEILRTARNGCHLYQKSYVNNFYYNKIKKKLCIYIIKTIFHPIVMVR